MKRTPRIIFCLIIFALAVPATRAAEKWLRLTSEHFDMLSCTSERDSKKLLVQLEQFRECFFKLIPQSRIYDPRPLIFVFDSEKQYAPYMTRSPKGKEVPSVGLYMAGPFLPRILMQNSENEQGLPTIFHEYTHSLVLVRLGYNVPLWLNEGLATLYQTFTADGDAVTWGRANGILFLTLKFKPESLLPLDTLFSVDYKSKYYNEEDKMAMFYSQSWLLLHYVMFGKQTGKYDFGKLCRFATESTRPGAVKSEVFARIFGSDYKKLEQELGGYLFSGGYVYANDKIPAKPIRDKITSRPATADEREIELAGARWRANNTADAATLLALAQKYPDNPRVYEILAEIEMSRGEILDATDYLRKAVAKKSTSPMVYVWLLRNYYAKSDLPLGYIMPDDMAAEYTSLVDRALELAPDCMDAYEMLAIIESQRATMRIKKLNEALKAAPEMTDPGKTYMAAAVIYWRLKKYDFAEPVLNALLQDPKYPYWLKWRAHELLRRIAKETGKPAPPPLPPQTNQNRPVIKMPSP